MSAWLDHVARWKDCIACPLCRQRDRICLARGTVPCDILFIGEAPGASEDAVGLPFWGPAGDLMQRIIDRALEGLHVDLPDNRWRPVQYALTNLVACFPAEAKAEGINEPAEEEILACRPRLVEFVNIAQPCLIVCVGALAADYVDHRDTVPCIDIIHPAGILRKDIPRVKKEQIVLHTAVTIRSAVERMLEPPRKPFAKWGTRYARVTSEKGLRERYQ